MFYDDELEACADKLKRESLCNWSRLPCKGFPIIFEGIKGRDMREEKSPSFFNPEEAAVVVQYVKDLKDARGINVLPSQIGVISPYRKQVQNTVVRKYPCLPHGRALEVLRREGVGESQNFHGMCRDIFCF